MRFADRFGLTTAPLMLRVLLALTFLWTGLGKLAEQTVVSPEQAARLASMGVDVTRMPGDETDTPTIQIPDPNTPTESPSEAPSEADDPPAEPTETAADLDEVALRHAVIRNASLTPAAGVTSAAGQDAFVPRPEDFANGGSVRNVYMIALIIAKNADPDLDAESNKPQPTWPKALGTGKWPVWLAWTVTISELCFGLLLLFGLTTRLAGLGVAGVMAGAIWLTQIGPAIQSGDTLLGFLPAYAVFDVGAWQPLMWQLCLLVAGLALACLGSGAVGLDRAIFGKKPEFTPGSEGAALEPVASAPAQRSSFDRVPDENPA